MIEIAYTQRRMVVSVFWLATDVFFGSFFWFDAFGLEMKYS